MSMTHFRPAFTAGERAFHAGLTLEDNPFQVSSEAAMDWTNGWKFAHAGKDIPALHVDRQEVAK